jgi:hypothetical protein
MKLLDETTTGRIKQEVGAHFPEGAVRDVAVVQHGDDPAVEPGQVGVQLTIESPAGMEADGQFLDFFKSTHREAFARLRHDLARDFPQATRIEIISGTDPRNRFVSQLQAAECPPAGEFTPVTARLAATDLETLDTLITVGVANNRSQAIRWLIGRVRERPAYASLRERAIEIEQLKSQL